MALNEPYQYPRMGALENRDSCAFTESGDSVWTAHMSPARYVGLVVIIPDLSVDSSWMSLHIGSGATASIASFQGIHFNGYHEFNLGEVQDYIHIKSEAKATF